jgi:leucyl-tRNA synthetase
MPDGAPGDPRPGEREGADEDHGAGIGEEDLRKAAQEAIASRLEGKSIRRIIVVPEKLVNVVVG